MVDLKLTYENIPLGSMEGSTTTGTYPQSFVDFNDLKTQRNVPKYATLEEGRTILDGTFLNFPDTPVGVGYMSTLMSGSDLSFSDDIVITRTYDQNYTAPRING